MEEPIAATIRHVDWDGVETVKTEIFDDIEQAVRMVRILCDKGQQAAILWSAFINPEWQGMGRE